MALAAILDIDGTLVDTNYHHAVAWSRAFRDQGETLPLARLHRAIGMGGDQLVAAVAGEEFEQRAGDAVREAETAQYERLIGEVRPLPGARELVLDLNGRGHRVVLASSAKSGEAEHYVDLLDLRDDVEAWTTSADVKRTKPEPDLVHAALGRAGETDGAVMVGDSVYDCQAAERADVPALGVLTGGFSREELSEAGPDAVFATPAELLDAIEETPLA